MNAGTGSLVAALNYHMTLAPTVLTVVDQHRDALAWLDTGMTIRPRQVEIQKVQEHKKILTEKEKELEKLATEKEWEEVDKENK